MRKTFSCRSLLFVVLVCEREKRGGEEGKERRKRGREGGREGRERERERLLSNLALDSECELHSGGDQMCVVEHHFDNRGVLSGPAQPLFLMEKMALVSST